MGDLILMTIARLVVPFILVFAAHVTMGGHLSPGGGFSGGTIAAAGVILAVLAWGPRATGIIRGHTILRRLEALSMLTYVVCGVVGIGVGKALLTNLDAGWPAGRIGALLSSGMIWALGLAVGLKVATTLIGIYERLGGAESEQGDG